MILQMGVQVNSRGHGDSLEVQFNKPEEIKVTDNGAVTRRDFGITSQHWAAVPIQRPPKVIHHEEFHFAPLMWAGSHSNDQNLAG